MHRLVALAALASCAGPAPPTSDGEGVTVRSRFLAGHAVLEIETGIATQPDLRREEGRIEVTLDGVGEEVAREAFMDVVPHPFVASFASRSVRGGSAIAIALSEPAERIETSTAIVEAAGALRAVIAFVDTAEEPGREARIHSALAEISREARAPCALVSERMLRGQIGADRLTNHLAADGGPYDALVRSGLERLAELAPFGTLHLEGPKGSETLSLADPDALGRARERAGDVRGLVLLLRAGIERLEPEALREAALRGLLAPSFPAERFGDAIRNADDAAALCARFGDPQGPSERDGEGFKGEIPQ